MPHTTASKQSADARQCEGIPRRLRPTIFQGSVKEIIPLQFGFCLFSVCVVSILRRGEGEVAGG